MRATQENFASERRIVFARRIVTRASDGTEDHDSLTPCEFEATEREGGFLLSWQANGLSYGLPLGLADELRANRIVIANLSRGMLPLLAAMFTNSFTVHVTAVPDVLVQRLRERGREDSMAQAARLERSVIQDATVVADITIDNSGQLANAVSQMEDVLQALLARAGSGTDMP